MSEPASSSWLVPASNVEPKSVDWLWSHRIPSGMVTMLAGNPGLGKTCLACDLCARVSTGSAWPDDAGRDRPAGLVAMLSTEDDAAYTLVPRLVAAGADMSRVAVVADLGVPDAWAASVAAWLDREPGVPKLVILDPLVSFMGRFRENENGSVRSAMAAAVQLAARSGAAVVGVHHQTKGLREAAVHRLSGSVAFGAVVRAAWTVFAGSADRNERRFLPAKMNVGRAAPGLSFKVGTGGKIDWLGECADHADDAASMPPVALRAVSPVRERLIPAMRALLEQNGGTMLARDFLDQLVDADFTRTAVLNADTRRAAGVVAVKPDVARGPHRVRLV